MVVADLHVHTDNSDGTLALDALPEAARAAGIKVVAVTDHDRLHPGIDCPVERREGVTLIHGIELRVESSAGRVDLLGYAVDPTPELREEVRRLQEDRIERGAAIIDRVESRLGIDLGLDPFEGIGRPHVARAIADHPGADYDVAGAFAELIGEDCPCYVPREVPTFERGRRLLAGACSLVGLAHPLRYPDPEAALELAAGLDAVERWYPYETAVDPAPVKDAIATHDLVATGGSDAHGERIGDTGLDHEAYDAVERRLPEPS
ncbi:MAG: PHP domain-containing protein [Halobacteriales archaeon]